jgi:tetratricopeptide (TPR) repeat protein
MKIKQYKMLLCLALVFAMQPIARAEVNADPEIEAKFREGMDALEDYRLKSAMRTFSQILDMNPRLHRARLELALAYYRSMRYEDAEKLANEVLDSPSTPPEVRVTILAFLAQVKRDSEQYGQKHLFKSFVSAGVMHDSNVNVGPSDSILRQGDVTLAPSSLAKSDNAYVVNAGFDHLYQSGKRIELGERVGMLVWQTSASAYSRMYNKFDEFDLAIASISTGPAMLMLRHWRASLLVRSDYMTLGGHALGWFNSIKPSVTWQFENSELTWDAIYTRRAYNRNIDEEREGDYLATGVDFGRYFNNRQLVTTLGVRAIGLFTDDDQFSYLGGQLNAGVHTDTWHNGSAYARGRISVFQYDGENPVFNKDRDDIEYSTTVGLMHEYKDDDDLMKNWVVNAYWERTNNDSNISVFSYIRNQWMISLTRSF